MDIVKHTLDSVIILFRMLRTGAVNKAGLPQLHNQIRYKLTLSEFISVVAARALISRRFNYLKQIHVCPAGWFYMHKTHICSGNQRLYVLLVNSAAGFAADQFRPEKY